MTLLEDARVKQLACKECIHWTKIEDADLKQRLELKGNWGKCSSFYTKETAGFNPDRDFTELRVHLFYGTKFIYSVETYCCAAFHGR